MALRICFLLLLASFCRASPRSWLLQRDTTFAITGITQPGPLHPRLEIRSLQQNADQWNLYLLAMESFKNMDQDQQLSYYQIAGIHGVPNTPWDGVDTNPKSGGAVGYCTHSSIVFPTWHRTYLALFEQVFYSVVQDVVKSFPPGDMRDRHATAALSIRIPYWDWAAPAPAGQSILPPSITIPFVDVMTPNGTQTISNPLHSYNFHPLTGSDMIYDPWASWPTTFRYPNSTNVSLVDTTFSNDSKAAAAIDNNANNIRDNVYNMFALCSNYTTFSNDATTSSTPGCHTSLEGIHDAIHTLVGGTNYGHMSWLWWAAFDPVFWLHHANVDRLFAMWQAIYPTSYVNTTVATGTTFTIAAGDVVDADSPLTPFHSDTAGTFWTSNALRDHRVLHYTYPEFMSTNGTSSAIMGVVNALYGSAPSPTSAKARRIPYAPPKWPAPFSRESKVRGSGTSKQDDYITNIVTQRFGLNGTYSILVFLGDPASPDDPATWPTDTALVGTHGVFAVPLPAGSPLPLLSVTGAVPLTTKLLAKVAAGELPSMQAGDVHPYLGKNLSWRVVRASDGASVDPASVPGLLVSVVSAQATRARNAHAFPIWGHWGTVTAATHRKPAGSRM